MAPADAPPPGTADIAIVGAGAAGLAAAIVAGRTNPSLRIWILDSAKRPGAKILVSGGTRCNVTNRAVSDRDFWGGKPTLVRRILRAFPAEATVAFFAELGVPLHEEADGKLFPDSNRARDVLDALLRAAANAGVRVLADHRVTRIDRDGERFLLRTAQGQINARLLVMATGGQSLPKTGSDGAGLEIARRLGHSIVPTTPALDPLILDASTSSVHAELSGVSHRAGMAVWIDGRVARRLEGAILWTHFGVSGPLALNASRHWLRARLDGRDVRLTLSFLPDESFTSLDAWWTDAAATHARSSPAALLSERLPASVAEALCRRSGIEAGTRLSQLAREERRALVGNLIEWELPVIGSRGYNFAEATAGGVTLDEVDPETMASRKCPGLFLAGEMLDVDGRLGGFNFQWAWASGFVAGRAAARAISHGAGSAPNASGIET